MSGNIINKYVWLLETIQHAGRITLEEISRKWQSAEALSGGNPLPERTFHRWRLAIEEMFDLTIACDRADDCRFHIEADSLAAHGGLRNWLLNTISASNLISNSKALQHRILVEDIPSGQLYLQPIIEAMKNNHRLRISYRKFGSAGAHTATVCPYAVRLFRQRWYLLALKGEEMRTYGLDRIAQIEELDAVFEMDDSFDLEEYFRGCVGVMAVEDYPVEEVRVKVSAQQANYLRTLKWDPSQAEVERTETHSVFSLRVRPTIELVQLLLMQADALEVISPQWLRDDMQNTTERMAEKYKKN